MVGGRALDVSHQLGLVSLKILVAEPHCLVRVDLQVRIRSHLLESVKVQLAGEAGELGMVEIFRKVLPLERVDVFHRETIPCCIPGRHARITVVDQMKRFCEEKTKNKTDDAFR